MLENRVIVTLLTTLGVVMSAGALIISLVAAEDRSAPPVTSAAIAQIPASTEFIAHSIVPNVEIPVVDASPPKKLSKAGIPPIEVMSELTLPVTRVSYRPPTSNVSPDAQARPRDLCVHWQIYKWVDASPNPVRIGEYYEECGSPSPEDAEAVPYSLINQENKMLRDQLSFIVGRLRWEDYLQLSSEYSQLH